MGETEKPFACTSNGCDMKFTNEDHLNVHRKKHDMVLNLGLACKNGDVADQTPTPTRFIRNCEEVGLFQDLQNVNPFDETFKKAVEHVKSGTLHIPEPSSDDTLHTPHIFPHIEANNHCIKFIEHDIKNQAHEFIINTIPAIKTDLIDKNGSGNQDCDRNSTLTNNDIEMLILTDEDIDASKKIRLELPKTTEDIKQKIKTALKNKLKSEGSTDSTSPTIKIAYLRINEDDNKMKANQKHFNGEKKRPKKSNELSDIEKKRALNRAAQLRSRTRKKIWANMMDKELNTLKTENKKLVFENQYLKTENTALKSLLLKHNNCSILQDPVLMEETQKLLSFKTPPLPPVESVASSKPSKHTKLVMPMPAQKISNLVAIEVPNVIGTLSTVQCTPIIGPLVAFPNGLTSETVQLATIIASNVQKTVNVIKNDAVKSIQPNT